MNQLNLYLISQDECTYYDTYDSAVVTAPDEATAKTIHPGGGEFNSSPYRAWCSSPELVSVTFLGVADSKLVQGVVLASFKAG